MRIVRDKPKSTVLTEEFWRNWKLKFISDHNKKFENKKRHLQSIDAENLPPLSQNG